MIGDLLHSLQLRPCFRKYILRGSNGVRLSIHLYRSALSLFSPEPSNFFVGKILPARHIASGIRAALWWKWFGLRPGATGFHGRATPLHNVVDLIIHDRLQDAPNESRFRIEVDGDEPCAFTLFGSMQEGDRRLRSGSVT